LVLIEGIELSLLEVLSVTILLTTLVVGTRIWYGAPDWRVAAIVFPLPLGALAYLLIGVSRSSVFPLAVTWQPDQVIYLGVTVFILVATLVAGQLVDARQSALSGMVETEQQYRTLFESSPVGIGVADRQGKLLVFNDAMLAPGGYTREDLAALGNDVAALYFDRSERERILEQLHRDGFVRDAEVLFKRKDGSPYEANLSLVPVEMGGDDALLAIVQDITERKGVEAALRNSERFLRLSQAVGHVGSWEWDLTTNSVRWSEEMYALHGIGPDDFDHTPEGYRRFVHEDDLAKVEQVITDLLNGKTNPVEYRMIRGDGRQRFISGTNAVVMGDHGEPVRVIGTCQDITDIKQVEEDLRESERRFRALSEASAEGVIIHDRGIILDANAAAAELMGLPPTEIVGTNGLQYLSADAREKVKQHIAREEPYAGEGTMTRPDGSSFDVEFEAYPVEYQGRQARVLSFRDVTVRLRAERALRESRQRLRNFAAKLEDAREQERTAIAREMHDELGQVLTGLKMDFAWLCQHVEPGDKVQQRVESMERLIDGMVHTVRDLSSRLRPGVLDDLGLISAIDWQVRDFRERANIECVVQVPPDIDNVDDVTATAVFRILQEALTNVARHSGATRVSVTLRVTTDALFLSVCDDGVGVPEEALWSTDSIGLIGMRERAGGLGGRVDVRPAESGGAAVELMLPR
jgi:PAS domain S-box-containing protein